MIIRRNFEDWRNVDDYRRNFDNYWRKFKDWRNVFPLSSRKRGTTNLVCRDSNYSRQVWIDRVNHHIKQVNDYDFFHPKLRKISLPTVVGVYLVLMMLY